jgi:hypothetical protein
MGIDASVAYPPIIDNQFRFLPSLAGSTVSHRARFVAGWATITRRDFAWPPPSTSSTAKSWGGKLRAVTNFGLSEKLQNRKKEKKRLRGFFTRIKELFRIPGL